MFKDMFWSSSPAMAQAECDWAASQRVSGSRRERYPNCLMRLSCLTLTPLAHLKV